ncbi:hypothetical protein BBF96_04625 [Anoxybacter fermentans]|uniref:Metallo-beta-lactamase domain-containing protein n=1 Tax=Anoxybacter fermentans TaxID=1323375 RepID=A0A3S9SWU2_9FIRM|nr:MBL fold metallo-hydrolase [Anoxybacter fermentans]AZR72738.1 hypothetical protein BBF96_04625 [Anoxybacter fermentans]
MIIILKQITEKLFYFDFPGKVILYINSDRGILIDAGIDDRIGRMIYKELENIGVVPEVLIITHAHADHFGGAAQLKKYYPEIKIMASSLTRSVVENPEYEPFYLYGAEPLSDLKNKFLLGKAIQVDQLITPGEDLCFFGEKWQVLDLQGHTPGQIGLIAPDKIILTADTFFPEEVIEKYRLLYHFSLEGALKSLKQLKKLAMEGEYQNFIPGHGKPYAKPQNVIQKNLQAIHETVEIIQEIIKKPHTREEVVAHIIERYKINETVSQYFLTFSAVSAYLSYLESEEMLNIEVRDGQLIFISR